MVINMGNLILCSGERTSRPYVFPSSNFRIYSIEELCYYLYNHVYLIEESLITDSLIDWIGTELKLTERSQKLKNMKEQGADIKTIVTCILCSCDYYNEGEIKDILKVLDTIIGMPLVKRNIIRATEFLKNKKYLESLRAYELILSSEGATDLTSEEYGSILHNMGVALVNTKGLSSASELFLRAYERNQREESLKQYLYTIKLKGEDIDKELEQLQLDDSLKKEIDNNIEIIFEEANESHSMSRIKRLRQYIAEGKIAEYYRDVDETIEKWKVAERPL
ncbi:MAG TPA: hypothetical protein GXZ21_12775 [Clostridiales bacterium]|nr:hypothetical protein [Clostridiales bacterium]